MAEAQERSAERPKVFISTRALMPARSPRNSYWACRSQTLSLTSTSMTSRRPSTWRSVSAASF